MKGVLAHVSPLKLSVGGDGNVRLQAEGGRGKQAVVRAVSSSSKGHPPALGIAVRSANSVLVSTVEGGQELAQR